MKKRGGFTLIEMLVVISVMTIISVVMVGYNRTSEKKIALFSDRAKVVGVLQRAKSFALEKRGDACAFGVHFEKPREMIIFQDLLTQGNRCREGSFNKQYDKNSDEKMENVSLDERLEFFKLPSGGNTHDVVFEIPYLETEGFGTIKVKISGTSEEASIEVGSGGEIYGSN